MGPPSATREARGQQANRRTWPGGWGRGGGGGARVPWSTRAMSLGSETTSRMRMRAPHLRQTVTSTAKTRAKRVAHPSRPAPRRRRSRRWRGRARAAARAPGRRGGRMRGGDPAIPSARHPRAILALARSRPSSRSQTVDTARHSVQDLFTLAPSIPTAPGHPNRRPLRTPGPAARRRGRANLPCPRSPDRPTPCAVAVRSSRHAGARLGRVRADSVAAAARLPSLSLPSHVPPTAPDPPHVIEAPPPHRSLDRLYAQEGACRGSARWLSANGSPPFCKPPTPPPGLPTGR